MPGFLPHLIAGSAMFLIGRYYYHSYFVGKNKVKENLMLLFACLLFSFIIDFFLIIYYTTQIFTFCTFVPYHNFIHISVAPIAIVLLLYFIFISKLKSKPIWIMGLWSLLLHLIMDFFLPDYGVWF